MKKDFQGKVRFLVEKDGVQIPRPISDRQLMKLEKPEYCDLFLPIHSARCLAAEAGNLNLRKKFPEGVWLQEMNLLAYIL